MEEKKRKIPILIRGIVVLFIVSGIVLGGTIGLRFLEKKQQRPRVIKALSSLVTDLKDEKYSIDKLYQLLEGGKTKSSGEFNIGTVDASLLGGYGKLEKLLTNSTIEGIIEKDNKRKKMETKFSYQTYGVNLANIECLIDERECFVKIPEVYEKYLRFKTANIKNQYENSLLYTILGGKIPLPEQEFSLYPFAEIEYMDLEAKKNRMIEFLEENSSELREWYQQIEVTKLSKEEEILFQGHYEVCTAYEFYMPTEFLKKLLWNLWGDLGEQFIWEDEVFHGIVYLNSKNQVLKLEGEGNIKIRGEEVLLISSLYLKGEENLWDTIHLDFKITQKRTEKSGSFILVVSNQFEGDVRNIHLQFKMLQPYVSTLLDMDGGYHRQNGESQIEFDLETPMIALDGTYQLSDLERAIQMPNKEDSVEIFKLSLVDLLQFVTKLNLKIFRE